MRSCYSGRESATRLARMTREQSQFGDSLPGNEFFFGLAIDKTIPKPHSLMVSNATFKLLEHLSDRSATLNYSESAP